MKRNILQECFSLLLDTVKKDLNGALRSDPPEDCSFFYKVNVRSEKINFRKMEAQKDHTIREETTRMKDDP